MRYISLFLSYLVIILVAVFIGWNSINSFILISDKDADIYPAIHYLPTIRVPEKIADLMVKSVEAKIIN